MAYTIPSSSSLGALYTSINTALGNALSLSVLVSVFFISFSLLARTRGSIEGIIGASFLSMVTAIGLAGMNAAPADWIYIPMVLFALSVVMRHLKNPDYG